MRRALAALGLAAVLALSGCATDDGYPAATAQSLQEAVHAVTTASSIGDWATAQGALVEAETRLATALDNGEISEERAAEISLAMEAVRIDLEALIAAQLQENEEDDGNGEGNGNGPPPDKGPPDKDKDKDGKKDK